MKKILFFMIFLCTGITSFSQQSRQEKQCDSIFSVMYAQNQFNGAVLIAEKGKIVFRKAYGLANEATKKVNTPETIFELASCSKQFTGAAIVLLKRDGKLNYNDKISKYLPELEFWGKVSIENLLRHTSGIPEYLGDMREGWDQTKIATNEDVIRFYAGRKDSLNFEPGSRERYCNTNYALLATIIERVSGKKYADFLSERIFKPLKMKNTFVYNRRESPRKLKNYATGYYWAKNSFAKVTSEQPEYGEKAVFYLDGVVGNAKVNSTVDDLFKWITALKNNTLFTQAEFEEMTSVGKTTGGKKIPYGFGFDVSKRENNFSFGHTGSWDGYTTFIYHNATTDRTYIVLENFALGAHPYDNVMQILNDQPLKVEYRKRISLSESEMKTFTGTYTDEESKEEHIISYLDGHLIYNTKRLNWDMRFFPAAQNEFQAVRQGGTDGCLKFTILENGDVKLEMTQYGDAVGQGIMKKQ